MINSEPVLPAPKTELEDFRRWQNRIVAEGVSHWGRKIEVIDWKPWHPQLKKDLAFIEEFAI